MINAVIERCAGIDVGKATLSVCVMVGPADGEARSECRTFGTTVAELKQLRAWLEQEGCTHVIMESTGSYWKPVFNILEGAVEVALANPHEVKARKGHKTDPKDAWWLAHLLRHGMVTPSFIPPRVQRELRDLTRRRKKIIHAASSEKNRVQKILEDANVKLGNVLSDIFGVSGQLMLEALLKGEADPEQVAQFARKQAKKKIPQIVAALQEHQMSDHHRMMVQFSLEHMRFLEEQISQLDREIRNKIQEAGYDRQYELLQTIPGIQQLTAATILAEVGSDTTPFASEKHLSSWAGLCPGNNRSAGKDKGGRITPGNRWLRGALTESAWGVAAKRPGDMLRDKFWRIAAKSRPKAVVAVAHHLLVLAYFVLQRQTPYEEKRGNPPTEEQRQRLIHHYIRRLGKLGIALRPVAAPVSANKTRTCRTSIGKQPAAQ
jgi:transposase